MGREKKKAKKKCCGKYKKTGKHCKDCPMILKPKKKKKTEKKKKKKAAKRKKKKAKEN